MADLFLVRHGQGSFGTDNYDLLSAVGEAQSRVLGDWMVSAGHAPEVVATGTLQRQIRTAELALEACGSGPPQSEWRTLQAFDEFGSEEILPAYDPRYAAPGALQAELAASDHPRRTFQAVYSAAVQRWVSGDHAGDYSIHWRDYQAQVMEGMRRLTGLNARSVWVFTSGGPITAVVQHLLSIPNSHAFDVNWALVNAGITRVRFSNSDGRMSLSGVNAFGHLEAKRDPRLLTYR